MLGVLCAAGKGSRMQEVQDRYNVKSKCLLPVGSGTILDAALIEMLQLCSRVFIVAGDHNYKEIQKHVLRASWPITVMVQKSTRYGGTAVAVWSALQKINVLTDQIIVNEMYSEGVLVVWSDMLFKIPQDSLPSLKKYDNVIYTTSVTKMKSDRFDGIVCSGDRVLALSPRTIPKQGPFLMTTGVYKLGLVKEFIAKYRETVSKSVTGELSVEVIFQQMLFEGLPFHAEALDFFIDLGTSEEYQQIIKMLGG